MTLIKSIKFRFAMFYSIIIFVFCLGFLLIINLFFNVYFNNEPRPLFQRIGNGMMLDINTLAQEQRNTIRDIRLNDLKEIQVLSLISVIPLAAGSFLVGYLLAERTFRPLSKLNKEMSLLDISNLDKEVTYSGPDDEIGQLIRNYNEMKLRLKKTFDREKEFISDASHELKTPLAVIQSNLDLVLSDESAKRDDVILSVREAIKGVKNIDELIENLFTLSIGNIQLEDDVNLGETVESQISLLKKIAEEKKVEITFNKPANQILRKGNTTMIGRAIFNLIENSIKYSKESGSQIEIKLEELNSKFKLSIKDNGIGMSTDDQSRMFERFYRADKSRSRKSGGFGLGLAIVKKVIEEHGWNIRVSSIENIGTEVVVEE